MPIAMLKCATIIAAINLCCGTSVSGRASGTPVALNAGNVQDIYDKVLNGNKEVLQSSGRRVIGVYFNSRSFILTVENKICVAYCCHNKVFHISWYL
eukprot:jgi/Botrbrau1/14551/Bobra.0170s0007.1